jgi:hypothetical protein
MVAHNDVFVSSRPAATARCVGVPRVDFPGHAVAWRRGFVSVFMTVKIGFGGDDCQR